MTQQNPLAATVAKNPSNQQTQLNTDAAGNLKIADQGNTALTTSGVLNGPTQVTSAPGILAAATNTLASQLVAALTTSQVGALYDAVLTTSTLAALTTTQIATLSTSQIVALAPSTVANLSYGGNDGSGIPIKNGLIFNPAPAGQAINILKK